MKVKNLNQLFTEFKKYREIKKNVDNEDNFYDYVNTGSCSLQSGSPQLGTIDLIEQEWITLKDYPNLIFDFPELNSKARIWGSEIGWNVLKVLKDIWTTGEIKDTYGLDLSWPNSEKTSEKPTEENNGNYIQF